MPNLENLVPYVKGRLMEIVNLQKKMADDMEKVKYTIISGNKLVRDQNVVSALQKEIQQDYADRINVIYAEVSAQLAAAQKVAYQEYYNTMPRPTADERGEISDVIKQFNISEDGNKIQQFIKDRDFHLDNETRMARIYVFAGKELGITTVAGQVEPENGMTTGTDVSEVDRELMERITRKTNDLQSKAKAEQDELMVRIAPALKVAQDHVDAVADAKRFYEIFHLTGLWSELTEFYTSGAVFNDPNKREEANFERIKIKNRLFELGANPDDPIDFSS